MSRFFVTDDFDQVLLDRLDVFYESVDEESSKKAGRIDVIVCSDGGEVDVLKAYIDAFDTAKRQDVVVATHVSGLAASCGSLLAINGSPGYRTISKHSYHYVHTGMAGAVGRNEVELERFSNVAKEHYRFVRDQYRRYANIPNLDEELRNDHLFVNASQAKRWGLVDKVVG